MSTSIGWRIFGVLTGMGVLMAGGGLVFFQTQTNAQSRSDRRDKDDDEDEDEDEDDDDESAGDGEEVEPRRVVGRRADEVDDPDDFDYLDEERDCSEFRHLTDPIKEIGEAIADHLEEATEVSFEEERRYGDEWLNDLTDIFGGELEHEGATIDYIESVAAPLMEYRIRDDTRYDFHLLHGSGVENALALPGGHIVITNELMNNWIENEAQLATVLGHEIAHVEHRHTAAMIGYAHAMGMDPNEALPRIIIGIGTRPFSSVQEEEADRTGARMIHSRGYSVFQSVAMWEGVDERHGTGGETDAEEEEQPSSIFGDIVGAVLGEVYNVVTTHPNPAKRACLLQQIAYDLYEEDPLREAYRGETNWARKESWSEEEY